MAMGAILVSGILILLEFSAVERRPTYAGLGNTAVGVTNIIAPLIGAALATISYGWLFAVSATISLVALIAMRWWVIEPRQTTPIIFDTEREMGYATPKNSSGVE